LPQVILDPARPRRVFRRSLTLRADPSSPALAALLARDPAWAAYLIADLAPPYAEHSTWFLADDAVVLLYRAFVIPVITVFGPATEAASLWREALAEIREAPLLFAVCLPEHRAFVESSVSFLEAHPMFRMRLIGTPAEAGPATRLGPADLAALRGLYEDGAARQEIPDFFEDSMVDAGIYYGVRDAGELVAVAGTHVLTPRAAAVGNVYVRHDARRRGLAARVTAAVARELRRREIETVVLNVRQDNTTAIRVYEKLGFVVHGEFLEGFARPRQAD